MTNWPGVTFLWAQMNANLLTDHLRKKGASYVRCWLIDQPDVAATERLSDGEDEGEFRVSVQLFDYCNSETGTVASGSAEMIELQMLDPAYSVHRVFVFRRGVFYPMAGVNDRWAKLEKSLKAGVDLTRMEYYRGTASPPSEPRTHRRSAVKFVDDQGMDSLKSVELA